MGQKPVQDIYTAAIFGAFILLVTMTAVMGNTVLLQSGIVQSGMTRASINSGDIASEAGLVVHGAGGLSECEVTYNLVSQGSGSLTAVSEEWQEEQEEDAIALYYAVYTCIERLPTIDDYI